jgi:DNA-directed RNA polymerase specialized sigma24 family protein
VAEEYRRLLGLLGSKEMESVVLHKLEGHTDQEIARLQGCAESTIERRLRLIRDA